MKKAPRAPVKPPFRLEMVRAGDLKDNPSNWRRHPAGQVSALRNLIHDPAVGWAGAFLFNERTGHLIDGHARKQIVGPEEFVPVLVGSWSPEAEKKILVTLDTSSRMAEADADALQALLEDVDLGGEDLTDLAEALDELTQEIGLEAILADGRLPPELKFLVKPPAQTWVLIGIPTLQFYEVNDLVERLSAVQGATLMEYLKARGTPYVEVDEARRALFAGRLQPFDAVTYSETGDNFLVTCRGFGEEDGAWGRTMKAWEETFGAGFVAVRAVCDKDGQVRFFDLSGGEREIVA
ncbi:MAG TPA: hypothetical protein VMY35_20090 [Phycisphaerae bacterium]|nr:hypothetical protein [Phycisphaerae bacterium]